MAEVGDPGRRRLRHAEKVILDGVEPRAQDRVRRKVDLLRAEVQILQGGHGGELEGQRCHPVGLDGQRAEARQAGYPRRNLHDRVPSDREEGQRDAAAQDVWHSRKLIAAQVEKGKPGQVSEGVWEVEKGIAAQSKLVECSARAERRRQEMQLVVLHRERAQRGERRDLIRKTLKQVVRQIDLREVSDSQYLRGECGGRLTLQHQLLASQRLCLHTEEVDDLA